jgi:hypothetical protein
MLQVLSSSACGARKLNHGQWIRNGLYRGRDNDDNNARGTFGGVLCAGYEFLKWASKARYGRKYVSARLNEPKFQGT